MHEGQVLMMALVVLSQAAWATDYTVDFSRVENLESIRPLVEGCADFDALEMYRQRLEDSANLEELRATLSGFGFGMFIGCPEGISGAGVSPVASPEAAKSTGYSVDFTRVRDFETLRPLVEGCADFDALEHFRPRMESAANLDTLRKTLTEVGFGMFDKCPAGVSGPGITPVE